MSAVLYFWNGEWTNEQINENFDCIPGEDNYEISEN